MRNTNWAGEKKENVRTALLIDIHNGVLENLLATAQHLLRQCKSIHRFRLRFECLVGVFFFFIDKCFHLHLLCFCDDILRLRWSFRACYSKHPSKWKRKIQNMAQTVNQIFPVLRTQSQISCTLNKLALTAAAPSSQTTHTFLCHLCSVVSTTTTSTTPNFALSPLASL